MKSIRLTLVLFLFVRCFTAVSQVTSDFSASDEGWTIFDTDTNVSSPVTYSAAGGNPGGFISFSSNTAFARSYYFNAPVKFLGNFSAAYNLNFNVDLMQSVAGTDNGFSDIVLTSASQTIVYQLPVKPAAGTWTTYAIPLNETAPGWHVGNNIGITPTRDQFKNLLLNLTAIRIRVKYVNGSTAPYIGFLDNAVIHLPATITPPVVSGVAPLFAKPGANVIIVGTNFNATTSQNVVYFGGVKTTPTTASATQLIVKVPQGAQFGRITVIDLATGRSAQSVANFSPEFNNNGDAGGRILRASMGTRVDIPFDITANNKGYFSVGDIDGDGFNDFLVNEAAATQFSVWRNTGAGGVITTASFDPKVTFHYANGSKGENLLYDVDGDGKLDVLLGNSDGSQSHIAIFRNTSTPGTVSFAPVQYINSSSYADGPLHVLDIDGDGRPELITTFDNSSGGASSYFSIFQNLSSPGDIEFASFQDFDYGIVNQSSLINSGDFDGDGKIDIAISSNFDSEIFIFQNTSTPGSLSFNTPFALNSGGVKGVAIADLDSDGKMDLAWVAESAASVHISKNISTPGVLTAASFAPVVTIASTVSGSQYGMIAVGDINGDTKPDLIVPGTTNIAILENKSASGTLDVNSFITGTPYPGHDANFNYFTSAIVVDMDGDGKLDVMAGEAYYNVAPGYVSIWQNQCFPAPVITSTTPAAAAGAAIAVTGNLFKTGVTAAPVYSRLGGMNATSSIASTTSASVTVPQGTKSGSLTLTTHGLTASAFYPVVFPTTNVIDASSFALGTTVSISANANYSLVVADWDDDGKSDIAYVDGYHNGKFLQNTHATAGQPIGAGSLTKLSIQFSTYNVLATLDIDGDGKLDIASGYGFFQNASTPGTISFPSAPTGANITNNFTQGVVADFNNDGKVDLAGVDNPPIVRIYENKSDNVNFTSTVGFETMVPNGINLTRTAQYGGISAADFDGDGNIDIVTSNESTNNFSYYKNLGVKGPITPTSFAAQVDIATGNSPYGIVAADFDGDGKPDVATTHFASTFISVFGNSSTQGTIAFAAPINVTCVNKGFDLIAQDMDGDGKQDIIVIHQSPSSFSVFQNTSTIGSINFAAPVNYALTDSPVELAAGDINLDNKPDLIFLSQASSSIKVFQNNIPSVLIKITTQPTNANVCAGKTATFTTAATGTTNLTYQWQKSPITPVAFNDIAEGNGSTGTATSTLSLDLSVVTGADQFLYRCRVGGDASSAVVTSSATLTIAPAVSDPVATSAGGCSGTTVTLSATGATDGSFRWYTTPTGTPITGETKSTFTTPVLTTTTTYYVSIVSGQCETNRVQVTATITDCSNPPGDNPPVFNSTTASAQAGGTAQVSVADLISDPDNNVDLSKLTIVTQPPSGAVATLDSKGNLTVDYTGITFVGVDRVVLQVCDKTNLCVEQTILIDVGGVLVVFNGVSPNGDAKNDSWIIFNIESLPDARENHVSIFDRWGAKVFDVENYDNTTNIFTGHTNSGSELPNGIYFYKISFASSTRKELTGYLSLKRD